MDNLRTKLYLNEEPWLNLPDDLLIIALTHKESSVPIHLRKYGFKDYETLEWFGDRVLDFMISNIIFEVKTVIQSSK